MSAIDIDTFRQYLRLEHGKLRDAEVNLYAVVRDELFLMPAFFEHYRRLGVEQFVIWDNGSIDGTGEFLACQPDCVVLSSSLKFGQSVTAAYPGGRPQSMRWGSFAKAVIPRTYLRDKYAIYADADEFLILPEGMNLSSAIDVLKTHNIDSVAANLVDFYPRSLLDVAGKASPQTFADLVRLYPYFDAYPLISVSEGEQPQKLHESASSRLFQQYRIGRESRFRRLLSRSRLIRATARTTSAVLKTPIVRWREGVWLEGGHRTNVPPTAKIVLTLAHFKFTHDFQEKIRRAIEWQSHVERGSKYVAYDRLLTAMRTRNEGFLCAESEMFEGPVQLESKGLMKWGF